MPRTLLVVPTGHGVGLTAACLGLIRSFDRCGVRVGYYKPIAQRGIAEGETDRSASLVRLISDIEPPEPINADHVEEMLSTGNIDEVMEEVVANSEGVMSSHDVVVVQGLTPGPGLAYSESVNLAVAKALDADVVLVGTAKGDQLRADRIADRMAIASRPYRSGEDVRVVGCLVNRLPNGNDEEVQSLRDALKPHKLQLVGASVRRVDLTYQRVCDVASDLSLCVLNGGDMNRRVSEIVICAQSVPGVLASIKPGALLVVPGDRHDVIMGACLKVLNGTPIAGLLLTVGIEPDREIWELTAAARASQLPILLARDFTYPVATAVFNMNPEVPVDDRERAEALTVAVADGIDEQWIRDLSVIDDRPVHHRLSPAAFRHRLTAMAKQGNKRIVLPEGAELRTLAAAAECAERGIARCVLLAHPDEVSEAVGKAGITLPTNVEVIDPASMIDKYVGRLVELRAHKGMTEPMARNQLADSITVGTMMLESGEVDGLVSGAIHTTAHTIRPALQIIRTKPGAALVSSVFFMLLPDDVVIYGDCAVNPNPTAEELADIAIQSATSARAFDIQPRVAMISFSTGESGTGSDVEKVAHATEIARGIDPSLVIDGPLQYDAAAVESVGQSKRPGSAVAGHANVFVFPDLNTGNTTYKAVQRSADVVSIGPMLQGLAKPVNDLSRGALVEDIVYTIALTAVQAMSKQ